MHKCAFTWGESKESLNVESLYPQEYFFILFLKMINIVQCVLITCQNQFLPYKVFSWDLTEIWEWMVTKTLVSMLHHLSINIDDPLGRGGHQVLRIQGRERQTSLPHLREIPTQHWTCRFSDTWWRPSPTDPSSLWGHPLTGPLLSLLSVVFLTQDTENLLTSCSRKPIPLSKQSTKSLWNTCLGRKALLIFMFYFRVGYCWGREVLLIFVCWSGV